MSTIIARMQRWQSVLPTEEQYLVYDLDGAIRALKRDHNLPWTLRKNSLRVFSDILEYPMPTDFQSLAYLEGREDSFESKPQPYYTSIKEFYQDPLNRSAVAIIWEDGTEYLGVRNNNLSGGKSLVDPVDNDTTKYTLSGDATAMVIDTTMTNDTNQTLKVTTVNVTDTFTVEHTPTTITDANYKRKYSFRKVYLPSIPTQITLRIGIDSSNYFYKTLTTQFSGQPFKANDFNVLAFDLNDCSQVGTPTSTFSYEAITIAGMASGVIYLDQSSLREWDLMDLWYYSKNVIKTLGNTTANQEYFMDTSLVYSTDSELVSPSEFVDVVMYDAMVNTIVDRENSKLYTAIDAKRQEAWTSLLQKYPDMEPLIQTNYWRFGTQDGLINYDLE